MKTVVFSPQRSTENEIATVVGLFERGLGTFHLRKSHYSSKKLRAYLDKIPAEFHNRIVLHSHHQLISKYNLKGIHISYNQRKKGYYSWWKLKLLRRKRPWITFSTSYHSISDLDIYKDIYDYVFLSPIYDSISKKDYQSGFTEFSLVGAIQRSKYRVIALGGVGVNQIDEIHRIGFYGCAFSGAIWTADDPIATFTELNERAKAFKTNKNQKAFD